MRLVVVVLHDRDRLAETVRTLIEGGGQCLTVLESYGVVQTGRHRLPLIGGARRLLRGAKHHSKTVFGLARDDEQAAEISQALVARLQLDDPGHGHVFCVDVAAFAGHYPWPTES